MLRPTQHYNNECVKLGAFYHLRMEKGPKKLLVHLIVSYRSMQMLLNKYDKIIY